MVRCSLVTLSLSDYAEAQLSYDDVGLPILIVYQGTLLISVIY